MDRDLAAIYGTGNYEPEQNDIEKMAAAELLVKLAEEEGVDLARFNDNEIAEMIGNLYKSAEETPAEEKKEEAKAKEKDSQFGQEHEKGESKEKEEKEEEAKEKAAEADFLGRVMAHSMVQELRDIEKQAMSEKGLGLVNKLKNFAGGRGAAAREAVSHLKGAVGKGTSLADRAKQVGRAIKSSPEGAVAALGATALATKGVHSAVKGKKEPEATKEGSAFEALAQQRAFEMAKQAGYVDEQGNLLVQTQEKQASALDQALELRALQICEESGIPVEWEQ